MNLEQRLKRSIARWNLLESKFYQAWSAGTLPVEALATYSREYGAFIARIADGWQAHGDNVVAAEEREHVAMWRSFAQALGTDIGEAQTPAVKALVDAADRFFADRASSLGALYAFEAQQPATTTSKLAGLREHYNIDPAAETYFEVHANEEQEPALLLDRMRVLPAAEQAQAAEACERMSEALRRALDGLYDSVAAPCA
jgi:pyrroloquinoline-quinone synthase